MTPPAEQVSDVRARQPRAIHSALVVLEEVARCGPGVTAREVSDNLGVPRATAYRLLNLLVQEEYLVRLPDLSGFALGQKVVQLAGIAVPAAPPKAVRDVMSELRSGIRGGVHLVRYDPMRLSVIDADPAFPLSNPERLARFVDASAMGQLLLAEQVRLGTVSSTTIEDPETDAAAIAGVVTARGYAAQVGKFTPGHGCLAVPIRDGAGSLVAGLCLSAPRPLIEKPGAVLDALLSQSRALAPLLA